MYHASKWGIEGFVESVSQEVKPFNIEITLIEPGPTKTAFLNSIISNPPSPAYEHTPAGDMHRMLFETSFPKVSDAGKVVDAIIASTNQHPAPMRLALGETAYNNIHSALKERLQALEKQKPIAFAAD